MVAELLDLPCVTCVATFARDGDTVRVEREVEGGREIVEAALPAVLTADKGLNQPRYASLKGIMAAKKKTIEEKPAATSEASLEIVALELPPPRKAGRVVGEGAAAVPDLVRALRDEAQVL
jgi:electron transfer flavoprotein beta subunit